MIKRRGLLKATALTGASIALFGASLAACASAPGSPTASKVRVGLIPILDALPMYVAEQEGYFKAQGVEVELILFASALERDAALSTGQLEVELNDLISTLLLSKEAYTPGSDMPKENAGVRVIRLAYRANPSLPMMTLLTAPNSQAKTPADLKGKQIAISNNTIIDYSTDEFLKKAGISPTDVQKLEVAKIPIRVEMLTRGQVEAATLPEPMATLAQLGGAKRLTDDGQSGFGTSVITARQNALNGNPEGIKRFLAAYESGVEAIARNPEKYRALFIEKAKIPDALQATLPVPPFPTAQVSTEAEVKSAIDWAKAKGLIEHNIGYSGLVDASFLPKTGSAPTK